MIDFAGSTDPQKAPPILEFFSYIIYETKSGAYKLRWNWRLKGTNGRIVVGGKEGDGFSSLRRARANFRLSQDMMMRDDFDERVITEPLPS